MIQQGTAGSHKEKRSCYAPEEGVRYDGEEKGCWLWKKPPPLSKKPVNRELMGIIESLQRQAEQMEESSEESSAKSEESSDKSDENLKSDEETEVPKPCDSSEKVSDETKENDVDPPQKRMKGADGKAVVNADEHIDGAEAEAESKSMAFN
ncbi:hypothetical protein TSUD_74740 [Trifolium subterraneum]|nr:hypothetical protein TSUD_74740 [Trifolium subterraneum]